MDRAKKRARKKQGRPATGKGLQIQVRIHDELLKAIDNWLRTNPAAKTRPEAIRQLTELALGRSRNARMGRPNTPVEAN